MSARSTTARCTSLTVSPLATGGAGSLPRRHKLALSALTCFGSTAPEGCRRIQDANSNTAPRINPSPRSTWGHIYEVSTRGRHHMFLWQHQQDHTPTARGRRSAETRAHTRGSECGQLSSDSPDNNASSSRNTSSDVPDKQNLVDDAEDPARAPNSAYRSFPSMPGLADTLSAPDIQRPGIAEISSASSEKMNIQAHNMNIPNTGH
jgi:hypothetical protein